MTMSPWPALAEVCQEPTVGKTPGTQQALTKCYCYHHCPLVAVVVAPVTQRAPAGHVS